MPKKAHSIHEELKTEGSNTQIMEFSGNATEHMTIREQVLIALWAEYQRDIPCLAHVKCNELGISLNEFETAYSKLENEGLLPDIRDLGLNGEGLKIAAAMMLADDSFACTAANLERAAQLTEHYGAHLLSKFISTISQERTQKYKAQLD